MIVNGAQEMGIDPLELRARNLIPPEKFPYQTVARNHLRFRRPAGAHGGRSRRSPTTTRSVPNRPSSGRTASGWASAFRPSSTWPAPARWKMMNDLGAKVGCYDVASVRVHPDGRITVFAGSHSHGQGHETTWSQIAADGSAATSTISTWWKAIPTACPWALAPGARGRSPPPAWRSTPPPTGWWRRLSAWRRT